MSIFRRDEIVKEIRFETFASGGPGGQHANRNATAVRAIHVPTGISAIARESRSQYKNREMAIDRLLQKLEKRMQRVKPRHRTKVPSRIVQERLTKKRQQSSKKELRRKVDTSSTD